MSRPTSPPAPVPAPVPSVAGPGFTVPTAINSTFDALLAGIVRGDYPAGCRLPAERELAKLLSTSRPTLREALRQLGEWNLVAPRRGSGVVVRPMREWSLDALPAYLRFAPHVVGAPTRAQVLLDVINLRRTVLVSIVAMVGARATAARLTPVRAAVARAWAARNNPVEFCRCDLEVMSSLLEASEFMPGLWLLNRMSSVYLDVVSTIGAAALPGDGYLQMYGDVLDALGRGESKVAAGKLDTWLAELDLAMTNTLELLT